MSIVLEYTSLSKIRSLFYYPRVLHLTIQELIAHNMQTRSQFFISDIYQHATWIVICALYSYPCLTSERVSCNVLPRGRHYPWEIQGAHIIALRRSHLTSGNIINEHALKLFFCFLSFSFFLLLTRTPHVARHQPSATAHRLLLLLLRLLLFFLLPFLFSFFWKPLSTR